MATFTASAAQSTQPAFYNAAGPVTRVVKYVFTVSASAGDVIQMVKVPQGAIVNAVQLACSFSAGVTTVNIGDGNDVSAYAASVVLSGSVVSLAAMPYRGLGRSYSAEDTVDIQIAAISTPPGDGKLTLTISYTNQNDNQ
jgi:hypothetical protein